MTATAADPLHDLSDEAIMQGVHEILASCQRILGMSEAQRCTPSPKGTSAQEFGVVQAHCLVLFCNEAARRGLMEAL